MLLLFGAIEHDLAEALRGSLQGFIDSFGDEIGKKPLVFPKSVPEPEEIDQTCGGYSFMRKLDQLPGEITLGVTDAGLYDHGCSRNIFGYGNGGRGIMSTYRFRTETGDKSVLVQRLSKEIIKILGLACDIGQCNDPGCVMVYHRKVGDLDRNRSVCPRCRNRFIERFQKYYKNQE